MLRKERKICVVFCARLRAGRLWPTHRFTKSAPWTVICPRGARFSAFVELIDQPEIREDPAVVYESLWKRPAFQPHDGFSVLAQELHHHINGIERFLQLFRLHANPALSGVVLPALAADAKNAVYVLV